MHDPMRARWKDFAFPVALAAALTLPLAWLGLQDTAWTDYETEAEPAVDRLRSGDVGGFLDALPAYGGSLVLRAPFALVGDLWGGGSLAAFRSLAVPCLVAAAALGVLLWRRVTAGGATRAAAVAALALCVANPLTVMALEFGHPEELLGGVLCVGAVLAAGAGRPLLAGVLLGLAVANKPWAVLAVAPVVLVSHGQRMLLLAAAAATAGAVLAPLVLAGSAAVSQAGAVAADSGQIFKPFQVWWFLGEHAGPAAGELPRAPGYRSAPDWVGAVARPLVLLVPVAVCLALARRLRQRPWQDGLLLLALVLLLRCILDPWNIGYYEIPFLLALTAWEVHARPGAPVIALTAALLCYLSLRGAASIVSPDLQAACFLAWSVPFAAAMLLRLAAPGRLAERLAPPRSPLTAGSPGY